MTKCPAKNNEKDKPRKIAFKKVVEGKPAFEVCRLFLATLQLVSIICFNTDFNFHAIISH